MSRYAHVARMSCKGMLFLSKVVSHPGGTIFYPRQRKLDTIQRENDRLGDYTTMRLPLQDIERFYHLWFALLHSVNAQLSAADLAVVESWQYRVEDSFSIVRSLQKHTIFLSHTTPAHVYGVLGLVSTIEETLPLPLPVYAKAVLLPFEHHIIYDSLLVSYNVVLGPGIRRNLQEHYRTLQEREGIITSLLPEDLAISTRDQRQEISARNRKVFTAFRRELRKGGLSEHMVDVHAMTIEDFAQETLLETDPPQRTMNLVNRPSSQGA